ncbi:MAG: class I tRNA ligase family protein, partial [Eubacteriales bacterium]|nr:class I tRNA ligase family protein [Eubacteriales bacterium]
MSDNKSYLKEIPKNFDSLSREQEIFEFWERSKFFEAKVNPDREPFCIMMPPPNITGQLHMGHALTYSLQDSLTRWKRMQGYETLWLPGSDHAAIATEAKIVEQMASEGLTKADLGRDGFLERAYEWKEKYQNRIMTQLRRLGTSCDFTKERFTMDEGCSHAVNRCFVELYKRGKIYRGEHMVNWCPGCGTSISDAEVSYEEEQSYLWEIDYPIVGGDSVLTIATTRPETLLGDTALAVHPDDERYRGLIGQMVEVPICKRQIPIIADEYVEMDFGTGVVKITPAHDPNDYEVGRRHNLEIINIFTDDGKLNELCGNYAGQSILDARKLIEL